MYSRIVANQTLDFEHARFLHQGSFVMFDRQTVSLWIHTTGEAVIGDLKGESIDFLPSTVATWSHWKKLHPATKVLDVKEGRGGRFNLKTKPQAGGISVGQPSRQLKLFPLSQLREHRVINDRVGRTAIVIYFDAEEFAFHAYERGDRMFSLGKDNQLLDSSGEVWNPYTGKSKDLTLIPVPATPWNTNAWKRFYPQGEIYSDE